MLVKSKGRSMTDASLPAARFAEGDFRIGRAISRASSVFFRNFVAFFAVTAVASLPAFFWPAASPSPAVSADPSPLRGGLFVMVIVLDALSHAIVLYGAAQDMRASRSGLPTASRWAGAGLCRSSASASA
jgi:hypothetical protein